MKKIICFILLTPFCIEGLAQSMVPKAPKLNLDSYILLEASTNTVLAEFNSDNQISPASMTKVMTGYVIADQIANGAISLDDNYVAPHYMLGMTLNSMGKFDDAEEELDIAQEIAEDTDNTKALANVYNFKGVFYRFKGQYKKSIRFFERGLKFQKEVHDEITEASILHNMSACLANVVIKEHDKALQLLKRRKEIYKQY